MSALTRWDPFRETRVWDPFKELEDMQSRLSRIFGRAPVSKEGGKEEMTIAEWSPLVDISEDDKEYLVKAELPDIKKEDIKLNVHNDVLSIS